INAQNRFCLILSMVARDRRIASTTSRTSFLMRMMPPVSLATSEPEPMATPMSATASAGEQDDLDLLAAQRGDRLFCLGFERVSDRDHTGEDAVKSNQHGGLAFAFEARHLRLRGFGPDAFTRKQASVAKQYPDTSDPPPPLPLPGGG